MVRKVEGLWCFVDGSRAAVDFVRRTPVPFDLMDLTNFISAAPPLFSGVGRRGGSCRRFCCSRQAGEYRGCS